MGEVIKKVLGFAVAACVGYGAAKVVPITVNDGIDEPLAPPLPQRKVEPAADVDMVWKIYNTEDGWVGEEPGLRHPELLQLTSHSLYYEENRNWQFMGNGGHVYDAADVYKANMTWATPPREIDFGREDGLVFSYTRNITYDPILEDDHYNRNVEYDTPGFSFVTTVECEYVGDGEFRYGPGWEYNICYVDSDGHNESFNGILGLMYISNRKLPPVDEVADGNWELVIKQRLYIGAGIYEFRYRYRLESGSGPIGARYYTLDDWIDYWGNVEREAKSSNSATCARFNKEAMESWKEANGLVDKIY